jgi:azurin
MPAGTVSAYDLAVGVIVNMDEAIYLYTPEELPLLTGMGADGNSVLSTAPLDQIEFKWQDEEYLPPRSALAASMTAAETTLTVAAGDQLKFSTGDIIQVRKAAGTEIMRITAYGSTADTFTVTRAFAGSATTYVTGQIVIGLGTALPEGSDPEDSRQIDRTARSNVTQIFGPTKLKMTGTALVVPRYGVPNEWAHQLYARTYENGQMREQALLYGRKTNSSTTKIRTMGGLAEYITTVVDATSTQLTVATIQANQQTSYGEGGVGDILTANPLALNDLNDPENTSRVRVEFDDPRRGRIRVTAIETEFGTVTVQRNRHCHPIDAFCWRREQARRRILRPFQFEVLAKTGDSRSAQILCEESLEFKGEKHAFRMNSLTYTGI